MMDEDMAEMGAEEHGEEEAEDEALDVAAAFANMQMVCDGEWCHVMAHMVHVHAAWPVSSRRPTVQGQIHFLQLPAVLPLATDTAAAAAAAKREPGVAEARPMGMDQPAFTDVQVCAVPSKPPA
jgi:hypothetical protein